jgi:hypothetical protein
VIKAKRQGKEVHAAAQPTEEEPTDLMAALRASLEGARGGRRGRSRTGSNGSSSNGSSGDELADLSKSELEQRAKKARIEGRSKMSKEELIEALRSAA